MPGDRERACILSADYSQIELRLLAHISKDINLIDAFNSMSERLHSYEEKNIDKLTIERNKFEAVLMSIVNGVVVCDNNDNVTLINKSAQKMLGVKEFSILNTKIQEYKDSHNEYCFKEKIEQFKETPLDIMENKPIEFNVEVAQLTLKAIISPMFSKNQEYNGYLIVLINITKEDYANLLPKVIDFPPLPS